MVGEDADGAAVGKEEAIEDAAGPVVEEGKAEAEEDGSEEAGWIQPKTNTAAIRTTKRKKRMRHQTRPVLL